MDYSVYAVEDPIRAGDAVQRSKGTTRTIREDDISVSEVIRRWRGRAGTADNEDSPPPPMAPNVGIERLRHVLTDNLDMILPVIETAIRTVGNKYVGEVARFILESRLGRYASR